MIIQLGAEVRCTDGHCGKLTRIVVDRASRKVTHLIVREPTFTGVEKTVPGDNLVDGPPGPIRLALSMDQLAGMPAFSYHDTQALLEGEGRPPYSDPQYGFKGGSSWEFAHPDPATGDHAPGGTPEAPNDDITAGELAVDDRARVNATDGNIGLLHEIVVDPGTREVTHIIAREHQLLGNRDRKIPVANIERAHGGTIYLALSAKQARSLPNVDDR
jgi:hypothetical protein